jgi:hypothetical protein
MEDLCLVGVFLLFVIAWIYDGISKQVKGSNNSSRKSSSTSKPVTRSKRGSCRYCGAEVIVDEIPDSLSREAFEDFGACEVCQSEIFMQNGGHF